MKLLVLCPRGDAPAGGRPGILWIHGGGYLTGMPEMVYTSRAKNLARKYGAVVVSPGYRLSGEAPYPAALLDCHNALTYLKTHARELGVRDDQLMVGGESAGGGLTAALCMYERDTDGVRIAFQMPLYPMLDNEDTETSRDNHAPVWNTRRNHFGWSRYLRGLGGGDVPAYAAPARCTGLSTFLSVSSASLCRARPVYGLRQPSPGLYLCEHGRAVLRGDADLYPKPEGGRRSRLCRRLPRPLPCL